MRTIKANMKWMAGATLAGALLLATPHQAQAQVSFGIGVSSYGAPSHGYGDPYAYREVQRQRWIAHEQREQWEAARAAEWRHEQWERQRVYSRDSENSRGRYDHPRYDRY